MKRRPPYADPVKEMKARVGEILLSNAERRSARFNESFTTVGAILNTMRGGDLATSHPDRCRCQDASGEKDSHKHYPEAPFPCARGCGCKAYHPAIEEEEPR